MPISCVYCGGLHDDPAQVRDCWQRSQGVEASTADSRIPVEPPAVAAAPPAASPAPRPSRVQRTPTGAYPARIHGPIKPQPALGRNVIVAPGEPTPNGWEHAERLIVDPDDAGQLMQIVAAAHERRPMVFEVSAAVQAVLDAAQSSTAPAHVLGVQHTFHIDTARQFVTSNSVRVDGGEWRWPLLDAALALGVQLAEVDGDVVTPDGGPAWLDGGPPRWTAPLGGVGVLHRVAVEHGSLTPLGHNASEAELAPDQLAAVTHLGGSARIIAPAGSGKTRVLTERARHLVREWGLPSSALCLIAFNKRAQEEMTARTSDLPGLQIRTLNALAMAIINGAPPFAAQPRRWNVIDEPDIRRLIGKLVTFPRKRNADPVATWMEALSLARLGLVSASDVEASYAGEVEGFEVVLPRYRAALADAGSVDFDEMIAKAIELLLGEPAVRAAAQRACRMLLVDEFQDLTPAHVMLVRLVAGPDLAVFGVGDDDQTIYGYNGADPQWLIGFGDLFPGAGDHPLTVNYRCPADVVQAADTLLRHNRRRVAKTITAASATTGLTMLPPSDDPVRATVDAVRTAIDNGVPAHDIAVLTRVNSLLAPPQVALHEAGIATNGGVGREFLDRTAVRAALAWLRLAASSGQFDPADVSEALRRPSRSLHPRIANWAGEQTSIAGLRRLANRITTERDAERVAEFTDDIERLQRLAAGGGTTSAILTAVRDGMGLASSIASLDTHRRGMNRTAQNDDLTAMAQLAELHPEAGSFEPWLRRALSERWQPDGVTLATVHRVKGQEWPVVVVHGADADQFPHRLAENVEEERRLFHVALTRASRRAIVVAGAQPSPFIDECATEPSAHRAPVEPHSTPRSVTSKSAKPPAVELSGGDAELFERLRSLRRHLAAGKPAYTVLSDATLRDIAAARPATTAELARIRGVGPAKLQQYGDAFLAAVSDEQ
jgi:DNA helicase II / ATP-dependent DNA helicase PcrA